MLIYYVIEMIDDLVLGDEGLMLIAMPH
jgi:hypothetical protein